MGKAGGSARAEYERRRERDRERIRSNLGPRIAVVVLTPFVAFLLVRVGLPWSLDLTFEGVSPTDGPIAGSATQPVDSGLFTTAAAVVAIGATAWVGRQLFGRRATTGAWRKGAEGEERTARLLDRLPPGFTVLHDLPMPRSRANVDHVVVGPTGVFTVETKAYAAGVRVRGGRVTSGGRRRGGIVEQAQRQAAAISERIGWPVRPIVVVHGGVDVGWFGTGVVDGVQLCSPGRLLRALTRGDEQLTAGEAGEVVTRLALGPDPASPSTVGPGGAAEGEPSDRCPCGGTWVRRQRRADGRPFLGCSAFPACRRTRPLADPA